MPVGKLAHVKAWVDKMPVGKPSLHVVGTIEAPTPCHTATTTHTGDTKKKPPDYLLQVETRAASGNCIQKVHPVSFHHVVTSYAGSHGTVIVSSATDSKTVTIGTVH